VSTGCTVRGALIAAACALLLAGCDSRSRSMPDAADAGEAGAGEAEAGSLGVSLDVEQQARLGVSIARLEAAEFEQRVEGAGTVLEVQPIVEAMASLITAEAAVEQSSAARERAASLFGADAAVSREVLESAVRQAASDQAALDVARARAAVAFGIAAPWLDASRRADILGSLTDGRSAVVRTGFPGGLPAGLPAGISFRRIGASATEATWQAADVWDGPADPAVPGPALMAYVESAAGLVPGTRVTGFFGTGARQSGVVVPTSAVVFAGGAAWCYLADGEGVFLRAAVDLGRPLGGGYFQPTGFDAGDAVVVAGAGLLLAREMSGAEEED